MLEIIQETKSFPIDLTITKNIDIRNNEFIQSNFYQGCPLLKIKNHNLTKLNTR